MEKKIEKYPKKKTLRRPSHPGEILKNVWLDELNFTQSHFCDLLVKVSNQNSKKTTMQTKLNEVLSGKRSMSADFAVLISKVLKTNPRMWMNLQIELDIWEAEQKAA